MRKLVLLLAAGALWLFLAAIPVFADGGPHVAATNSGVSTLTPDSCAGCHRAHTAQGQYLINQPTEEALCLSCHGTAMAGATTDVMDGVQYAVNANGSRNEATTLGALRAGGFDKAHIGNVGRLQVTGTSASFRTKVTVSDTAFDVTSAHIELTDNGLTNPHTLWGNGAVNSGAGPTVSLECTDCHNPHGNGSYRILNTVPAPTGAAAISNSAVALHIAAVDANTDVVYTKEGSPFFQGDLITIAGTGTALDGNWVVYAMPNGITMQLQTVANGLSAAAAYDITPAMVPASITASMVINRTSAPVADSPMGTPDGTGRYPTKNYTVIQTPGTQATGAGYLFYASQVVSGGYSNLSGDYFHRYVPWNAATTTNKYDAPNGLPVTVASANQVGFNQQMTSWCASCHTRYFAYQNPSPAGTQQGSSTFNARVVASFSGTDVTISGTDATGASITSAGFNLGDRVQFATSTPAVATGYVTYSSGYVIRVSLSLGGTPVTFTAASGNVTRIAPASASQWWFPRQSSTGTVDSIFKYQHSTRADRVCTTCHVAHGSDRVMTGTYSLTYTQPDGSPASQYTVLNPATGSGNVVSADSRLLKVDNRGTCESCHDPTGTWAAGNTGIYQGAYSDTLGRAVTGGTPGTNSAGQPTYTGVTVILP